MFANLREAVKERTRERAPREWDRTEENLARATNQLAMRRGIYRP